jgi:lysozyme
MTLREQLILHEGIRLEPYRDTAGKLTIGVGRNLTDRGISREEAEHLLDNDIREHSDQLFQALPWIASLDEIRQRVLLDMAFNMGVPGLLKFRNTLRAVKEGRYKDAAQGMEASLWYRQTTSRAQRLVQMMRTGEDYTT